MSTDVPVDECQPASARLVELLRRVTGSFPSESALHSAIEKRLVSAGWSHEHEFALTAGERLDFLVNGDIAVEVKIGGSIVALFAQLQRYAKHPSISAIVVVTTLLRLSRVPDVICGKPVHVVYIGGAGL